MKRPHARGFYGSDRLCPLMRDYLTSRIHNNVHFSEYRPADENYDKKDEHLGCHPECRGDRLLLYLQGGRQKFRLFFLEKVSSELVPVLPETGESAPVMLEKKKYWLQVYVSYSYIHRLLKRSCPAELKAVEMGVNPSLFLHKLVMISILDYLPPFHDQNPV